MSRNTCERDRSAPNPLGGGVMSRLATYLSFVRFSHSVFALPFALTGALLAAREHPLTWTHLLWIVVAMVAARSAAMGFNRLVDARYRRAESSNGDARATRAAR